MAQPIRPGALSTEEAAAATIAEYEAKIAALERKVGPLTMEVDLLKKTPRLRPDNSSETLSIIIGPLAAPSNGGHMIQLPRSSFYDRPSAPELALSDARLVDLMEHIQNALPGYGSRRVTCALQAQGYNVHHKRVARIMKQQDLGFKSKRRFVRTTDSPHDGPIFPN